ncbi:MAG: hypothetical protein QGI75_04480 [Phycisphaerales bacterium]|jgi:hypothetical protein|nr:hypothetical protein [Phycisphaerales bacterium]MDP6889951.1 hypothetical protein [Phycisphaerales bacterium]
MTPTHLLHASLSLLAALSIGIAATAQGLGSLPAIMKPEYFSRDLLLFIEGLNLTEEQQLIAEMIFDDYEREFQEGLDGMENQVTDVANNVAELGDDKDAIVKAVLAPIQGWAGQRDVLGLRLVENIRVILDPQQQSDWTAFNRRLDREKRLPDGRLSGENTNIDHVLRDLDLQPAAGTPLEEAKLQWELALHEALIERAEATRQNFNLLEQINNNTDEGDVQKRRQELAARIRVRDTTDAAIEEMAALLPTHGDAFRREALKRGYARVYRPTPAERLFKAAMQNETVRADTSLLAAVENLFAEYLAELDVINTVILDLTRKWEPELEESKIQNRLRRLRGETLDRPTDPTRELYQQRRELDARYVELLRDLLGLELFSELDGASRYMPRPKPGDQDAVKGGPGGIRATGKASSPKERGETASGKLTGPDKTFGNERPPSPTGGSKGRDD